jgi:hypothetical protein
LRKWSRQFSYGFQESFFAAFDCLLLIERLMDISEEGLRTCMNRPYQKADDVLA